MKAVPIRVDAGDIVLFSSSHLLSYGAKLFTFSEWDHVGIVIRWFNQSLRILEATGEGVGLYDLDARMREAQLTVKLAVRRLHVQRSQELLDQLYQFVKNVKGRPFKRDLTEIARAAGKLQNKEDLSSLFCSQLCAAAYQTMKLLSASKPSNQYLPGDWGQRSCDTLVHEPTGPEWNLALKMHLRIAKDGKKQKPTQSTPTPSVPIQTHSQLLAPSPAAAALSRSPSPDKRWTLDTSPRQARKEAAPVLGGAREPRAVTTGSVQHLLMPNPIAAPVKPTGHEKKLLRQTSRAEVKPLPPALDVMQLLELTDDKHG